MVNVSTLFVMFKPASARHISMPTHSDTAKNILSPYALIYHLLIILFLFSSTVAESIAEEKIATGKFVVSLTADSNQKDWVVNALEQNIYNDLSGYARVVPFKKLIDKEQLCKKRNTDCILEVYKKLNADALMLGVVDKSDIDYEIYDIQNKTLINTGSIEIGRGASLLKLRLGAFNAFKPFIEKGGILDKRKYNSTNGVKTPEAKDKITEKDSNEKLKEQALIFFAVFTLLPYLLTFIGKPRRHPERAKIIFKWFYPFQIVMLAIIGYQYILVTSGNSNFFNIIFNLFDGYQWFLTGLAGIVWGYFLIVNIKVIIPHLQGLERIKPNILFPLLQSAVMTILIKTLIIVSFYLCFFYGIFYLGNVFSMDSEVIIILLFPFSGLYIIYWVALMLDVFSMSLDVKLSGSDLDYKNVWNVKIRKYFIAHLKRNGVTLNKFLVEDVVFLPGQNKGIVCYGGGFSRPRITIEKDLIKFALGDIDDFNPEETDIYTQQVFDTVLRQHSVYKIVANISSRLKKKILFKSRHDVKRVKYIESVQKFFQRDLTSPVKKLNERTENVMRGKVIPRLDTNIADPSLMFENIEDMQIIEALLNDNPLNTYHYDPDAEVDDASEEDKDFLFGAILHKFGELLRREDVFTTVYLYLRFKRGAKSHSYNFIFSKHFAVVADTFVVLNFGLNHLMQHLFYQATNDPAFLTQKGIPSRMLKSQDEILISAKKAADERKPKLIRTDELERIVWLSRFCQGSIKLQHGINIRSKRVFKWSFYLGVTYLASLVIINSYNYHPRYLEIIEQEKQEIEEAIKNEQEKERKEK